MIFTADFETTTDPNDCRVWAWAVCEVGNIINFEYGNTLESFIEYISKGENNTYYFHNLKFDSEFIFNYLLKNGFTHIGKRDKPRTKTFKTIISDKGQFYNVKIYFYVIGNKRKTATLYDSLKVLPFSVAQIAKAFGLKMQKLEIDYKAFRPIGHILTLEEVAYIRNDVSIVAQALDVLFTQGLTKMTQASNALFDYKNTVGEKQFEHWFPTPDYDEDVRQAYKGGFTFLRSEYRSRNVGCGLVLDVNSLYPSVMRNCPLPYGEPIFFRGEYEPDPVYNLYVQMFRCQFKLKEGYIPTIQLKNNLSFVPTQYLESSVIIDDEGNEIDEAVTMCLTSVDLEIFKEHYNIYNVEYFSGWKFKSTTGLFTDYIDKWIKVKNEATINGNKGMRTLAKLMLNALYGKFATSPKVRSKSPYMLDGVIHYKTEQWETKAPLYIPVGEFITAWARYKTITSAQKVYPFFRYADTDSLHLEIELPESIWKLTQKELENLTTETLREHGINFPEGFEIDPVKLGAWKVEGRFHRARFIRQKSYIEDSNPPHTWNTENYDSSLLKITCAGMPEACYKWVTWENFYEGQSYSGKLQPVHVEGGIVLKDIDFTLKKSF